MQLKKHCFFGGHDLIATDVHTVGSALTAQSSVNLLLLVMTFPDVILEAPDVSISLTTYQHVALDNMI